MSALQLVQYGPPAALDRPWPASNLHTLVPPIQVKEGLRFASTAAVSRADVINLEQKLAALLRERQARASGLCPIRFDSTLQCFDELIRQVYVGQPDAGELLAQIRDELRRNVAIYQSLYMDQLECIERMQDNDPERDLDSLAVKIQELEAENARMSRELAEVQARLNVAEKEETERRGLQEKRHTEEQVFLRKQQIQLQSQWDNRQQQ